MTGSAGFIGSHLVDRLLSDGERVLGIDSFDPYYPAAMKRRNLAGALANPRFTFRKADLATVRFDRLLSRATRVYHLAAQPGVRGSWGPLFHHYVQNNVLATQALIESMVRARRPNRLVYSSSSSVYGPQPPGAMREDALPNPISPYGVTKLAGEHLGRLYAAERDLPFVALRFFTVYGPRQRPDMAFHRFFRAAEEDRPLEILGSGRQMRDFTFVGDIVEGMVRAGSLERARGVYNLGRGAPVRLLEAVRQIGEIADAKIRLHRSARPLGDPDLTWADTRRARRELGYRPRVDIADGLRRQWAWHQGDHSALFG